MPTQTSPWKRNFPQTEELEQKVQSAKYIVGLDLHKKTTAVTIYEKDGLVGKKVFQRKRLPNLEVLEAISKFPGKKVVVCEAAFGWQTARKAFSVIEEVCFVPLDARKVCAWAQATGIKNDRIDSEALVYAIITGSIPRLAVYQPSQESQDQFKLIRIRDKMVIQRTMVINQLKRLAFDYGPNPFTAEISDKSEIVIDLENQLKELHIYFNQKIDILDKKMANITAKDPIITLLQNIPGIGAVTSFALRTKIDNIERFESAKHLCSYLGFSIRESQSGETLKKGKISKTGNSLVRKNVIQGAQTIKTHHPEYYDLFYPWASTRYPKFKKCNKLTVSVARKLITFVYYSWTRQIPFDIEEYKKHCLDERSKTAELPGELVS